MNVIALINESLESKARKGKKPKRTYFYVSEAGKTAYEIFKKLVTVGFYTPRVRRVLDNGNCVHDRIIGYLEQQGVVKAKNVKMNKWLFHGRADAILSIENKLVVLEVKSMNSNRFENLKKYGERCAYLQLQLYMHFLGIDDGIILVECKDDQRLKEFHIKRKLRVAQEVITKFAKLKKRFVEAGVMLP